jgi:hypothetical protein
MKYLRRNSKPSQILLENEGRGTFSNSLYEVNIPLIINPDKDINRKVQMNILQKYRSQKPLQKYL